MDSGFRFQSFFSHAPDVATKYNFVEFHIYHHFSFRLSFLSKNSSNSLSKIPVG